MAKRKRPKKSNYATRVAAGIFGVLAAILFMPTTIMLFFSMLPTAVAAVIDRAGKGTRGITVGAMNLAGTTPFLFQLWTTGHTAENAVAIISDPRAIVVIYCAAAVGYLIDWGVSGIVSNIMMLRCQSRLKDIQKTQEALIVRWGREVTGELPLDHYGFPLDNTPALRKAGTEGDTKSTAAD